MDFNIKVNYDDITEICKQELKNYVDAIFIEHQKELFLIVDEKKKQETERQLQQVNEQATQEIQNAISEIKLQCQNVVREIAEMLFNTLNINDKKKREQIQKNMMHLLNNKLAEVVKK